MECPPPAPRRDSAGPDASARAKTSTIFLLLQVARSKQLSRRWVLGQSHTLHDT